MPQSTTVRRRPDSSASKLRGPRPEGAAFSGAADKTGVRSLPYGFSGSVKVDPRDEIAVVATGAWRG
jgi:hypothetical protein